MPVVLLSGSCGAGKTALAEAVGDRLRERDHPHAVLDVDWLAQLHPAAPDDPWNDELAWANVAATWPNFRDRGAEVLVLARVIETEGELDAVRRAIPGARITLVRVTAPRELRHERIAARESHVPMREHLQRRTDEIEQVLDDAALEQHRIHNDGARPLAKLADEVLELAGLARQM